MVEIGLEAVDNDLMPKDLYLSLRIGEQQKFAKASTSRAYKFAQSAVAERRYAKLEIYRRVGICSVSIDMEKVKGTHEIAVPVDDPRLCENEVRYRITMEPAASEKIRAAPTAPEPPLSSQDKPLAKDPSAKVLAAREYLEKHQLEQRLSEAMQAVLRERPEDPGAFVAQKLASGAGIMRKVPDAAPEAAPLAEAEAEAPTRPLAPAVPRPLADPILPAALMVSAGHVGFSSARGPCLMIL